MGYSWAARNGCSLERSGYRRRHHSALAVSLRMSRIPNGNTKMGYRPVFPNSGCRIHHLGRAVYPACAMGHPSSTPHQTPVCLYCAASPTRNQPLSSCRLFLSYLILSVSVMCPAFFLSAPIRYLKAGFPLHFYPLMIY